MLSFFLGGNWEGVEESVVFFDVKKYMVKCLEFIDVMILFF